MRLAIPDGIVAEMEAGASLTLSVVGGTACVTLIDVRRSLMLNHASVDGLACALDLVDADAYRWRAGRIATAAAKLAERDDPSLSLTERLAAELGEDVASITGVDLAVAAQSYRRASPVLLD